LVTERLQYSIRFCFLTKQQNQENMLILNRLRFILSVLLLLAFEGTFHQARHSFATSVCLSQGVPIETLSQMMGHRNIKTTQIYAEVTGAKIEEDMQLLSQKIGDKFVLTGSKTKK
jgi:site-specific recombinase XerD